MVTYQKRPTQYKEVELLPDVDLNPFVEGTPLTVGTVLIPEEGTGLVEIISESLDAAGISTTCRAGQFLRLTDAPGLPLELSVTDHSLADNPDYVAI